MSLTDWDVVLPAFDRALEEMDRKYGNSKEGALRCLRDSGILALMEEWEEEDRKEAEARKNNGTESTL
jgi:hypothetical protein